MSPRAFAFVCALLGGVQTAQAQCRQALALGLDVSGSVDAREYQLQVDGLVPALNAPKVREALLTLQSFPVALLVYEWSGPNDQQILLPWTDVTSEDVLADILLRLSATTRRDASPGTAIGISMRKGAGYLAQRSDCQKLTLDISGDGKSNMGQRPDQVKRDLAKLGITINGLVIGADAPNIGDLRQSEIGELSSYFRANVIVGEDAFVETALGFEDFAAAMARKLERELQVLVFSDARPTPTAPARQ